MNEPEQVELRGSASSLVTPAQWQVRVDELTALLVESGLTAVQIADDLREAFGSITFKSADDRNWRHDGATWWLWDGSNWRVELPPPQLRLDKVVFDQEPEADFVATHLVPAEGMPAWAAPEPTSSPVSTLAGSLDVELLEQRSDGWALVRCSNEWTTWVDGRLLDPVERP